MIRFGESGTLSAKVVGGMRLGRNTILGGVLLSCLTGLGSPAGAQTFDIPEGFVVAKEPEVADSAEWEPVLSVTPEAGSFSELSRIELRRVTGDVADPDDWLRARMTVDVGTPSDADEMLNSPDSPFADPAFDALKEAIPHLFRGLEQLSKMPLSFCEGPETAYNAAGELRELYCVYQVGPLRQYVTLRLQKAGGRWYFTEIRAMNEKRLRHLIAIANSFRAGG
jgi:hypothetical protein